MSPATTKDATGRMRFHGQGKRGQPTVVRTAIGSLGLAIKSLKAARDHLTRVALEKPDRLQRDALIAEARSQVELGVRLAGEAMTEGLPKGKAGKIEKTSANQMKFDLKKGTPWPSTSARMHGVTSGTTARSSRWQTGRRNGSPARLR